MTTRRRKLFAFVTLFLGVVIGLGLAELGLRYYAVYIQSRQEMDSGFLTYHSMFGWEMARNWKGRHRHFDFDVEYSTNEYGLRGPWPEPSPVAKRYALAGDSFTFGLGANDDETFVRRLSEANSKVVYLNAGIAGYSTDQQFLYL